MISPGGAPAPVLSFTPALEAQLRHWLNEDIGRGDLTAPALIGRTGRAHWVTRADGVFCGGVLVGPLLALLDPRASVRLLVADGEPVVAGQRLLELEGPAAALVAAERTALNLAMRLSGIATATAALVQALAGTGVRLADTRKTTPGLRVLEKYAVRCGGGCNHRLGLDDAAMLKENHLAWSGGVAPSILRWCVCWESRRPSIGRCSRGCGQRASACSSTTALCTCSPTTGGREAVKGRPPLPRPMASRPSACPFSQAWPAGSACGSCRLWRR